jgi:hypothetical protein
MSSLPDIHWPKLALGVFIAAVCALSVHSIMLQGMGVPFPDLSLIPPVFKFLIRVVAILGLIFFWQLASRKISTSFVKQWGLLFLVTAMLTENLIRGPLMQAYCTDAWIFAFVGNIPKVLTIAVSSAIIVALTPRLQPIWQKVMAAFGIAALSMFAVTPLLGAAMAPVMQAIAHLAPQGEWCALPYGANVLIPAYITYAEPAIACMVMAMLAWDQLSPSRGLRHVQFTVLILAINYQLLMPIVYASFAKLSFMNALISEGQFALEALVLAMLTGIGWEWSSNHAKT